MPLARPAEDPRPGGLAASYARMHAVLLRPPDPAAFLGEIAGLATRLLGDTSCGISFRRDGEVATIAASDPLARIVDEVQYSSGEGPCMTAMATDAVVRIDDVTGDGRWPRYRAHALELGIGAALAIPLHCAGDVVGALNLFSTRTGRFAADDVREAGDFTHEAGTLLAVVLRSCDDAQLAAQMRAALDTRAIVHQGLGIVMARRRCTSAEAFDVLRIASQHRNKPLREVAADLIEAVSGQPPLPPRPFANPR